MQGVEHIDEIIQVSDGIMVARGDMGVEIPNEDVPVMQKMIIKKVYNAGKQVITATQMLDSMVKNPRPTRAETADVANAIYDGTSAIMLSGETAAGLYPVESLQTMVRIAVRTEADIDYKKRFFSLSRKANPDITDAISHATCTTAHDLNARAIITVSKSGRTARMVSKQDTFDLFDNAIQVIQDIGLLKQDDLTVITAGVPLGISGTTNMIKVHTVGRSRNK